MDLMMSNMTLYSEIEAKIEGRREEEDDYTLISTSITSNIKQSLRDYQLKALENFIYYFEKNKKYKAIPNKHLLFHMATGSGKTNIIASTILYLYEKGYRDFIFFVNTANIITKTKDNIINKYSQKYLFKDKIIIKNQEININEITDTFDVSKKDDINIMFTTIHKLHGDLETLVKENSITYSDFEERKIVLIADEAHHVKEEQEWGKTARKLLYRNKANILLEFTATAELHSKDRAKDYKNKHIAEYPLVKFREDGYSKDIKLINDNFTNTQRTLQSLMISEFRRYIAKKHLNKVFKPIVMFKNPKGIAKINASFEEFKKLIENLSIKDIDEIFNISDIQAIQELKELIGNDKQKLVNDIQYNFSSDKAIVIYSTSADKEVKLKLLNSLENPKNPIRVIFAVNVLNEGWDVLNLFDIVKLDEAKKGGASTTSEAQLIGRGARYYPFDYKDEDKYKRKFDVDFTNPLRYLEQMYFHSINKNEYITSLKKELSKIGLLDNEDEIKEVKLKLKDTFLNDELYKNGVVYVNAKIPQDKSKINSIYDYYKSNSYKTQNISIDNSSKELQIFDEDIPDVKFLKPISFKIKDINKDIVRSAINKKPFFYFSNIKKYFKNLKSISEFISSDDYLGSIEISVRFTKKQDIDTKLYLNLVSEILENIEKKILKNSTDYIGSTQFYPIRISSKIPKEKILKLKNIDNSKDINQDDKDWYVFEKHQGTSEEISFVMDFMVKVIDDLKNRYNIVKLLRNEKAFNIHSFDSTRNGAKFEPDFILLLRDESCYYQIFCEPKGDWAKDDLDGFENSPEKWKDDFLSAITNFTNKSKINLADVNQDSLHLYENNCYKIYGLPFYNQANESEFRDDFKNMLL